MSRVDPSRTALPEIAPEPDDFTQLDVTASVQTIPPKNPCRPAEAVLAFRSRSDPSFSEVRCSSFGELDAIRKHLERGFTNWHIGREDVGAVHRQLETLPPDRYGLALTVMDREGLLSRYVDSFTSAERRAFLEQAASKGMATRTTAPAPSNGGPAAPPRFDFPGLAPAPLRSAAFEDASEALFQYPRDYRRAVDSYAERVARVPDGAELRRLGPPPVPADLQYLVDASDTQARLNLASVASQNTGIFRDANAAVAKRLGQLRGEKARFALKATVDLGVLVKWKHELTIDKDRIVVSPRPARLGIPVGIPVGRGPGGDKPSSIKLATEFDEQGLSAVSGGFKRYGASVSRDGSFEVSAPVGPLTGTYAKAGPGTFGGGVKAGMDGLGVSLGFEVNTLSQDDLALVNCRYTPFDIPDELRAGQSLESLPPDLIRQLLAMGWTPREWAERQSALRAGGQP